MKILHQLFILSLCTIAPYAYSNNQIEKNPNVLLNPQDVPIFYDNHPLAGIKSFTIVTSLPFDDIKMQKNLESSIEEKLKVGGDVLHLKDNDMRGFGAGTILLIQAGSVKAWDGSNLAISRISLSIETSVVLNQTGMKVFPMVWNINTFLDGSIECISEDSLIKATQKLIGDFLQNYQHANQQLMNKPIFYTYN